MPIALIILLLVFGAVVAAGLPILLSLVAITLAVGLTALVGQTFSVSVFAINMISMMGLATGIDYSLFIVSRFREERARGRDKLDAIAVTGGTASRAVLFSGLTVVLALLGLLIVPTNIFASLAIGAILVVSMSVLAALTLLPAVLGLLGDRVNSLQAAVPGPAACIDNRAAGRTSLDRPRRLPRHEAARRSPWSSASPSCCVLAYPALDMKTGVSGVNTFPNSFQSKQGFAVLEKQFSAGSVNPVQIVVDGQRDHAGRQGGDRPAHAGARRATRRSDPSQTQTAKAGDLALLSVPVNGDATGNLALDKVRELRGTLIPQAFDGIGGVRLRDRPDRRQPRLHRHRQQLLPVGRGARPQPQLRAAAGRLPLGRHPAQGDPHEPAQRGRGLRPHHAGLAARAGAPACSASSRCR